MHVKVGQDNEIECLSKAVRVKVGHDNEIKCLSKAVCFEVGQDKEIECLSKAVCVKEGQISQSGFLIAKWRPLEITLFSHHCTMIYDIAMCSLELSCLS